MYLSSDGSTLGILTTALTVGLLLTLVNMIIRPIVKFFSMPLYFLSFGLFSFVVNALMLWIASALSTQLHGGIGGLYIDGGFGTFFWAALVLSAVQTVISWFTPGVRKSNGQLQPARSARQ